MPVASAAYPWLAGAVEPPRAPPLARRHPSGRCFGQRASSCAGAARAAAATGLSRPTLMQQQSNRIYDVFSVVLSRRRGAPHCLLYRQARAPAAPARSRECENCRAGPPPPRRCSALPSRRRRAPFQPPVCLCPMSVPHVLNVCLLLHHFFVLSPLLRTPSLAARCSRR